VVTKATKVEVGSGLGARNRIDTPFVGTDKAGCEFPCTKVSVWKTVIWDPFSVARINASSLAVNATWVGRAGRGIVACGWKGLVLTLSSPVEGASMAFLIESMVATTRQSGPAPTTMPLVCATAKREVFGEGSAF
jgi:hypothetical protein